MSPTTIPILPSRSFDSTAAFYAALGFDEARRFPGDYLILTHPVGVELHFWLDADLDPASNQAGCYIRFPTRDSALDLHAAWSASDLDVGHLRPLAETDYGLCEFALMDPDRNLVRVGGVNP